MTDLDRFKAAADVLAEAVTHEREMVCQDIAMQIAASDAVDAALTEYRAARAAIETPQETSACIHITAEMARFCRVCNPYQPLIEEDQPHD